MALDNLETYQKVWARFKQDLAAAKNGEIKTALALKLEPAGTRGNADQAIHKGEADLLALAGSGYVKKATAGHRRMDRRRQGVVRRQGSLRQHAQRKADGGRHGEAREGARRRPGPRRARRRPARRHPAGSADRSHQARYGIKVKQYDHRNDKGSGGPRKAANPKTPDKAVKGLYQVLGKVPLKDTGKVTLIDRYTEESGGAAYGRGEIDLYCGRPGDGNVQEFNKKGEVVPDGEKIDKNCEPINARQKVGYFDFATLHEVGHAVDDKKNIMGGGRNADAGWEAPSKSAIAAVAAAHFKYDAGYIEAMLKSKTSTPPATRPALPSGADAAAWDLARQKAEDWVQVDPGRRRALVARGRQQAAGDRAAASTRRPTRATG